MAIRGHCIAPELKWGFELTDVLVNSVKVAIYRKKLNQNAGPCVLFNRNDPPSLGAVETERSTAPLFLLQYFQAFTVVRCSADFDPNSNFDPNSHPNVKNISVR